MKKLLLVLMVVALAAFLLVGCIPSTPAEGEGEGEGETEVTIVIGDAVVIDGNTYVKAGTHDIIVTFPAAVAGVVKANITACGGDYKVETTVAAPVVLFPDATKKIWTGSGTFVASSSNCCASYVEITSAECTSEVCIAFPIIVDGATPFAAIKVTADECTCDSMVVVHFDSTTTSSTCATSAECCGDDCSGLASWAIDIYSTNPFNICCDVPCVEPVYSCSGVGCAIACDTACLLTYGANGTGSAVSGVATLGQYFVVTTLLDEVGNKTRYYAKITLDAALVTAANASTTAVPVTTTEYAQNKTVGGGAVSATNPYVCTDFVGITGLDWIAVPYTYGNCSDTGDNIL